MRHTLRIIAASNDEDDGRADGRSTVHMQIALACGDCTLQPLTKPRLTHSLTHFTLSGSEKSRTQQIKAHRLRGDRTEEHCAIVC